MKATNGKSKRNGSPRDTQAALRALRRAARKVHAENRRWGLPLIVWKNGKMVAIPALSQPATPGQAGASRRTRTEASFSTLNHREALRELPWRDTTQNKLACGL